MKIKEIVKNLEKLLERPILSSFIVLVLIVATVGLLSFPYYEVNPKDFFRDVLVELHGTAFDLVVIGILILWLNQMGERRLRVRSYIDEIDDFRDWRADESKFRVIGNIRRLNRDKITKISLYNYVITKANLTHLNLNGSNMNYADLSRSKFNELEIKNTLMNQVNLSYAQLNTTDLSCSKLNGANLEKSSCILCSFEEAHLINANFEGAYLLDVNMRGSIFWEANIKDASFFKVDFRGAQGLTIEMLSEAKVLKDCKLDADLDKEYQELLKQRLDVKVA